ncbi:MAG: signal peptidase II [Eubacterium sp.]|jgi:lipoprotein signal peptidase|nr:signal peptidase II [Eubacterium sp.]
MNKKFLVTNLAFSTIFILFLLLDRITKKWAAVTLPKGDIDIIPDILTLHYLENRGAAWGIFQNAFWLFFIITIVVVGVMVYFYARIPFTRRYWYLRFTIILLSSGAIGNFIDRACWHYVVDFIYVEAINFPVFNVADCYVCIAAALLIHSFLFYYKEEELLWKKKKSS